MTPEVRPEAKPETKKDTEKKLSRASRERESTSTGLTSCLNEQSLNKFKRLLQEERERILKNTRSALQAELAHSTDDLMDETDLAVSEISQSLVFKLRDRERLLLQKIDQAMFRMAAGTFGICDDCEEMIEPRRLEARPVSTLCIACKEREEHREKIFA